MCHQNTQEQMKNETKYTRKKSGGPLINQKNIFFKKFVIRQTKWKKNRNKPMTNLNLTFLNFLWMCTTFFYISDLKIVTAPLPIWNERKITRLTIYAVLGWWKFRFHVRLFELCSFGGFQWKYSTFMKDSLPKNGEWSILGNFQSLKPRETLMKPRFPPRFPPTKDRLSNSKSTTVMIVPKLTQVQ